MRSTKRRAPARGSFSSFTDGLSEYDGDPGSDGD